MTIQRYFLIEESGYLDDAVGVDMDDIASLEETATDMEIRDQQVVHLYEVKRVGTYRARATITLEEIR